MPKKNKKIQKVETGSNMDGANMEGTKPNIKRVRLNSPNAPEYPPRPSMGRKRIDWKKKGNTPTGGGNNSGSGSNNLVKGKVNKKKFAYDDEGLDDAIDYATKLMRHKKPEDFEWHEKNLSKENGGGDGGGGAFGDGGGTVFTSTNAGIFNPTHGGNGKKQRVKSKKKRSGIERLGVFMTDGSPQKKMKKDATAKLDKWVKKQEEEKLPKFVERTGSSPNDSRMVTEQLDMEEKIKRINDEEKKKEDDNFPVTDGVSSHMSDLQLSKQPQAFGNPQDDELQRGAKKDKLNKPKDEQSFEFMVSDEDIEKDFFKRYSGILKEMNISENDILNKDEEIFLTKSDDITVEQLLRIPLDK